MVGRGGYTNFLPRALCLFGEKLAESVVSKGARDFFLSSIQAAALEGGGGDTRAPTEFIVVLATRKNLYGKVVPRLYLRKRAGG